METLYSVWLLIAEGNGRHILHATTMRSGELWNEVLYWRSFSYIIAVDVYPLADFVPLQETRLVGHIIRLIWQCAHER